jgi:hypothetical protein
MSNDFVVFMRLLPSAVGHRPRLDTAPLSLRLHYEAFSTTTSSSAPVSCFGNLLLLGSADLNLSLGIKTTGSHVPCKSPSRSHAAFEPDAAWAGSSCLRPNLSRDDHRTSVLAPTMSFRPFIDGLLSLISPRLTQAESSPALPATLTTTALNGSSLQRFAPNS